MGGNVVGVRLLAQHGVPAARGGAGITIDMTVEAVTQFAFTLAGIAALAAISPDRSWTAWAEGFVAISVLALGGFVVAQRVGLMRLIEAPGKVVSGTVELEGRRLDTLTEKQWRRVRGSDVAMVFQDPMSGFDPLRPIGHQIVEAIRLHQGVSKEVARRRTVELLGDVEITDPARRFDAYPHEFSGGMRQRAMIAMALANDPKVLIADEPTTALDVTTQATILRLMRRLSDERGAAMILISHDLGVVAQLCDTVQVMYAGKTVERGPALEVLTRPRHRYTEALLRSVVRRTISRWSISTHGAGSSWDGSSSSRPAVVPFSVIG